MDSRIAEKLSAFSVLDRNSLQDLMLQFVSRARSLELCEIAERLSNCPVLPVSISNIERLHEVSELSPSYPVRAESDAFSCSKLDKYLDEASQWNLVPLVSEKSQLPFSVTENVEFGLGAFVNKFDVEDKQSFLQSHSPPKDGSIAADANYLYVSHEQRFIKVRGSYRPSTEPRPFPDPVLELCDFSEPTLVQSSVCGKDFCVLGCICSSLNEELAEEEHCRKEHCLFGCICSSRPKKACKIRSRIKPYSKTAKKPCKPTKELVVSLKRVCIPKSVAVFCLEHEQYNCYCFTVPLVERELPSNVMEDIPSSVCSDSPVDSLDTEESSCSSAVFSPTDLKLLLSVNASPSPTKESHSVIDVASASEDIEVGHKWDETITIDLSEMDNLKPSSYLLDDSSSDSENSDHELSNEEQIPSEVTKVSPESFVANEPQLNGLTECKSSECNTNKPKSDLEVCLESAKQSLLETFFKVDGVLKVQSRRLLAQPRDTSLNLSLMCPFENFDEFNIQAAAQMQTRKFIHACKSGSKITVIKDLFDNTDSFTTVRIEVLRTWFVSRQIAFKLHICSTGRSTLYFTESDIEVDCCGHGRNKTLFFPENKSDLRDLPFGLIEYFRDLLELKVVPRKVDFNSASVLVTPYKWKDSNCQLKFLRIISGIVEYSPEKENIVDHALAWSNSPCSRHILSESTSLFADTAFALPAQNQEVLFEETDIGNADVVSSERLNLLHSYLLSEYSTFADLLLKKLNKRECLNPNQSAMEWVVIDTKFNAAAQLFDSDIQINRLVSEGTKTEILHIQFLDLTVSCFSICLTQIPDYLFIGPIKRETAVTLSESFRYCFILSSFDISRNSESTSFFHSYAVNSDNCLPLSENRATVPRLIDSYRLKLIGSLVNAAKLVCQFYFNFLECKVYVYFEQKVLYATTSLQGALERYQAEFSNWKLIARLVDSSLNVFMIVHTSKGYRVVNDRLLSDVSDSVISCLTYLICKKLLLSLTLTYELVAYSRDENEPSHRCSFYYCSVQSQWYGSFWFADQPSKRIIMPVNEAVGVFAYRLKGLCRNWSADFQQEVDFSTYACSFHSTCMLRSSGQYLEARRLLTRQINVQKSASSSTTADPPQQYSRKEKCAVSKKEKCAVSRRNYSAHLKDLFSRLSFQLDVDPRLGKLLTKRSILNQATDEIKRLRQSNEELSRFRGLLSKQLEKRLLRLHKLQTNSE